MFFCPPGRDDSDALTALGVGYMEEHPLAHSKQINPLLTVVFAFVDGLDSKGIVSRFGGLIEGHAVLAPIGGGFLPAPFETIVCQ
jgi:hypothetical protein